MITSLQNPLVKYIVKILHKNSFRRKEKKFVAEGTREVRRAMLGGYKVEKIIFCRDIFTSTGLLDELKKENPGVEVIEVTRQVYEHIAYRGSTEGIMILGRQKSHQPDWTTLPDRDLFLLLAEKIQKPGNIGALLRTTDAVGTSAVILSDPLTDIYNPNVIRSSLGTVFTQKIFIAGLDDIKNLKETLTIKIFAATLQNANIYWKEKYTNNVAIAVGNEAEGLSDEFRKWADKNIYIPMNGMADSLNVSVSAAVILYEALRQRS